MYVQIYKKKNKLSKRQITQMRPSTEYKTLNILYIKIPEIIEKKHGHAAV